MAINHYDVLEVSPKARKCVVNAAFRALSKEFGDANPDRRFLNEAHSILGDDDKRAAYDRSLLPKGKVERIGEYVILDQIGEGGFGVTYRARHEFSGKLVCIKKAHEMSAIDEELMLEEANAVWDLRHWAIPSVRTIMRCDDGKIAIVMSYIPGPNIQQIVEKRGPIKPLHVCWIIERALNALLYLHDNGVIHGDVKPGNIIVEAKTHQVALVDYGLSLVRPGRGSTNKGYTERFASPEQIANLTLLPQSDLYSLGLTMIYALGGDPQKREVPGSVPDPICQFIEKLIVRDILRRPDWKKENLCKTISDVRLKVFGSRTSEMEPLEI